MLSSQSRVESVVLWVGCGNAESNVFLFLIHVRGLFPYGGSTDVTAALSHVILGRKIAKSKGLEELSRICQLSLSLKCFPSFPFPILPHLGPMTRREAEKLFHFLSSIRSKETVLSVSTFCKWSHQAKEIEHEKPLL